MRILVHLDNLRVGGAQHSSLDLAVALEGAGHEVTLAAGPGPLTSVADERGLRRLALPGTDRPSRAVARALADAVDAVAPDVVFSVGPLAAIDAVTGAALGRRVPVVCAYPSSTLPPDAPRMTPVVGRRRAVLDAARRRGNPVVADVPATVDTTYNAPGLDGASFRQEHGLEGPPLALLVTRLSHEEKAVGTAVAVAAAGILAERRPFRLVILGDGSRREAVEALAEREGGGAVHLAGELADPRPAYAAADVVLGLGTSVLRGMAAERPCIALGDRGQATVVEEAAVPALVETGWLASGEPCSPEALAGMLESLLDDRDRAARCARAGRAAVVAERDGPRVVEVLEPVLSAAQLPGRAVLAVDVVRSRVGWWVRLHGGRLYRKVRYRFRRLRRWSR